MSLPVAGEGAGWDLPWAATSGADDIKSELKTTKLANTYFFIDVLLYYVHYFYAYKGRELA